MRNFVRFAGLCLVAALVGCDSSSEGDDDASGGSTSSSPASTGVGGDGGGSTASSSGTGGKSAEDVTDPEKCDDGGQGGAIAWECNSLTLTLSEPVPLTGLTVALDTDKGNFTEADLCPPGDPVGVDGCRVLVDADPVNSLIVGNTAPQYFDPTTVHIVLTAGGDTLADQQFDDIDYHCDAKNGQFGWCWESDPLAVTVTLP